MFFTRGRLKVSLCNLADYSFIRLNKLKVLLRSFLSDRSKGMKMSSDLIVRHRYFILVAIMCSNAIENKPVF